jgi:hypothetical protein
LSLNPNLANKITPNNYGLSDRNEIRIVLYDELYTIGVSARGLNYGTASTIELRDAAEIFHARATDAKTKRFDLVVKMDCEGSEFPIFERLIAADLLSEASRAEPHHHQRSSNQSGFDSRSQPAQHR